MGVDCPTCKAELTCALSLTTEESDLPIEISYQWWRCKGCDERFYARLTDSHVNMFDDKLEHAGSKAPREEWEKTLEACRACPTPGKSTCACAIHADLPPFTSSGAAWYTNE